MFRWMPKLHGQEYLAILSEPGALSAVLNWYRAMGLGEKFPYNADINIPVLFIWGNRDPAVSRRSVFLQDQYIKGIYKKIELDAGHWLLERRTDLVVQEMLKHISGASKN
jgi:pimeloyl-ACP methyl ester carboxylesterase